METPVDNEAQLIRDLLEVMLERYDEDNPSGRPAGRATHPRTIALVRSEFEVHTGLPADLRVGLFREPETFASYVRFSQSLQSDESKRDNRSLSIKIPLGSGDQDLVMRSSRTFYLKGAREFYQIVRNRRSPAKFFFPGANPLRWRLRELWLFQQGQRRFSNLLGIPYWSNLPYLFGEGRAMMFMVRPRPENSWKHAIPRSPTCLHQAMKEFLSTRAACFDFFVQLRTDPRTMPIEDARVAWPSPYHCVATLRIPAQPIEDDLFDSFAFDSWNALPEHRPLGSMNRARREIYPVLAELRRERNRAAPER